ncbi:hypothetical protein QBC41DRAFT_147193 [Cercophora samala]|uniref:Uncharacterized protein n=1 Tax=Cercophora samala TaxID=330535 RepID=A0AA40D9D2_9PEZI|nr:hypothetical protein QBC41DRAFT_147193 [Cercophora samala]
MPSSTTQACESSARRLGTPTRRAVPTLQPRPRQRTMAYSTKAVGPLLSPRGREDNALNVAEPPPPPPSLPGHRAEHVAPFSHPEITRRRPLRSTTVLIEYTTITTTPFVVVVDEGPLTTEVPDPPPSPEPSEQPLEHQEEPTTTPDTTPLVSTKPATLLTRTRLAEATEPTQTTSGVMDDAPYAPPPEPTASSAVGLSQYPANTALLTGECASAQYTLIDDGGPTMIYAPFVGCINDKPDCCPYTLSTTSQQIKAVVASSPGVFPTPQNQKDATMRSCAADYYSVSGSCCPSGYAPWTSVMGGQTPCISPRTATTEIPPITNAPAATTTKPTMAVTGVVFAMAYPLEETSGGLSGGTIAGIVVGIIMGVFFLAAVIFFICRFRRRKQLANFKKELHQNFYGDNGTGTSEVPTLVNNTNANSIRGSTTTMMAHSQRQSSLYGTQYLHHNTIKRDSAASVGHKEERDSSQINNSTEPYTPDSAYPQRPQAREAMVRRESSAHTLGSELSFPDDDFYDNIPPTPGTPGTLADGNHSPHNARSSSNNLTNDGAGSGSELHLAKPQRLSRGYPRIVYTHSHGHGSSTSVPATENGGSGFVSGGEGGGAGRTSTSTTGSASGAGCVSSRPPTRLGVMPGTPEEGNEASGEMERDKTEV